jgi:hypothetical protein
MAIGALAAAILTGGQLLKGFIDRQNEPELNIDPRANPMNYQRQLLMTGGDMAKMRQATMQNLQSGNAANLRSIERAGASRNMPGGALLSALRGSNQNMNRAMVGLEPQLRQQQMNSYSNFLGMNQPYQMAQARLGAQNQMGRNSDITSTLGALGKILLLSKAGMLGGGGQGDTGQGDFFSNLGMMNNYDDTDLGQGGTDWSNFLG